MENQTTEIICILDKSGSMQALQQETIQGLNEFIREQQAEEGSCHLTLVQFNQNVTASFKRRPIAELKQLSDMEYQPSGYTALLDAVGATLQTAMETQFYLSADAVPGKVVVFIITDGLENASRSYSKAKVAEMIRSLKEQKRWEFRFFGANVDAFGEAADLGIGIDKAMNWEYNRTGVNYMMKQMSAVTKDFRKK